MKWCRRKETSDTNALHTDLFPGHPQVQVLRHDDNFRVAVLGWEDDGSVAHPQYVAVVQLTPGQWDWGYDATGVKFSKFARLNTRVKGNLSIGSTFRDEGLQPVQNRLLTVAWPKVFVPRWVVKALHSKAMLWKLEIYEFCAQVEGKLYIYGQVCEFHPWPDTMPPRKRIGSLPIWQLFGLRKQAVRYLVGASKPKGKHLPVLWLARIVALPRAWQMARVAHTVSPK
jgi:hypothetical protein